MKRWWLLVPAPLDEPGHAAHRGRRAGAGPRCARAGLPRSAGRSPRGGRASRRGAASWGRSSAASRSVRLALYPSSTRSQCWYEARRAGRRRALVTPWLRRRRRRSATLASRVATAPPSPRGEVLRRVEGEDRRVPEVARAHAVALHLDAVRRVLDDEEAVRVGDGAQRPHVGELPVEVHGEDADGASARRRRGPRPDR